MSHGLVAPDRAHHPSRFNGPTAAPRSSTGLHPLRPRDWGWGVGLVHRGTRLSTASIPRKSTSWSPIGAQDGNGKVNPQPRRVRGGLRWVSTAAERLGKGC